MRILQAPLNIANIPWELACAQRKLGHKSHCVQYYSSWAKFRCDVNLKLEEKSPIAALMKKCGFFLKALFAYDIFHFHFGITLLPRFWDLPVLKMFGKKIFFHYHGCDIKDRGVLIKKDRHSPCRLCHPIKCNANIRESVRMARKYCNGVFVGTPDLLEFYPEATWLPPPIHMEEIEDVKRKVLSSTRGNDAGKIVLLHAPSDRVLKGTQYVLRAVEELKKRYPIEFVLMENRPWEEVMAAMVKADVILDQFCMGAYGHFAAEGMAMGKPVVCYIREDTVKYYPADLPIVNANCDNLVHVVSKLLDDRGLIRRIGADGVAYIKKYHDPDSVAAKTIAMYENG